jgi:nucleoside triphosphate diphosphatase
MRFLKLLTNRDWEELPRELGDLLLQVLFYSEMAKEQGSFSIDDVLDCLSRKLIDRHPHVFSDVKAETSADVKRNWETLKLEERKNRVKNSEATSDDRPLKMSILGGISSSMPALAEAHKLSSRAAQVGFDWPDVDGLFDKLREETAELRKHLQEFPAPGPRPQGRGIAGSGRQSISDDLRGRLEEEVGDLFLVIVNIARFLAIDPESALRKTNRKFRRRFQWMEQRLHERQATPEAASMEELESLWQQAKQGEKQS